MKVAVTTLFVTLAASAAAVNLPLVRRQSGAPTDTDILNFALTLEHLENAFYSGALSKFTDADFTAAGFPSWTRGRFSQIAAHEADHVKFLSTALGGAATQPCTYDFGYNDVKGFADLSSALEQVGSSAYTGAAKYITNKDYLLAAATILSTESRHSAWVESSVREGSAWGTAYETPLDLNQVYTLASSFITSCPSTNPALPVTAYAKLTVSGTSSTGSNISLGYTAPGGSEALYAVFSSGQSVVVVALSGDATQVKIPSDLRGYVFLSVSTDKTGLDNSKTVAGPAILDFSFNSENQSEQVPF